jgi:transposase
LADLREESMNDTLAHTSLESLEVGATPLVRHFLQRLQLPELLQQYLPNRGRRPDALPVADTLCVLLTNLLLCRRPLYAVGGWAARRVPEHLGLRADQIALLRDDRFGRALDRLYRADRASLLTALVVRVVREFEVRYSQFHNDTTTVTVSGAYRDQRPPETTDRPPRIAFGFNKDHRPDLKQLLYSVTVSADGAVPVHCKIYDGNTTDDQVHVETWSFLCALVGHSDFLYVADSKLCTRDNMGHISDRDGRFLTVMPRTRAEDGWFRSYLQDHALEWEEVRREPNPRRRTDPDVVYHGVASPQRSSEGYRVLWYRSSQKQEEDRRYREERLAQVQAWQEGLQSSGRRRRYAMREAALAAGREILEQYRAGRWFTVGAREQVEVRFRQEGPGRPGPNTIYRRMEEISYEVELVGNEAVVLADTRCDGLFPLMTNDEQLSVREALEKYKYQPFIEKRHEGLKSVFGIMPVWLKSPSRVASLLWLYFVVELVGALIEREVRQQMSAGGLSSLRLYPEGRASEAPTAALVFGVLEGHRRHRLLDKSGNVLRTFYDALSEPTQETLQLLGVDRAAYGLA